MDRAVAGLPGTLFAGIGLWLALALPGVSLAAPVVVVLTGVEAESPDAKGRVAHELEGGGADARLLTLADLSEQVRVVSLDHRTEDAGCEGPIWVEDWLERLDRVEVTVQLLDFNQALALVGELELEVGCLDRVPQRTDLLRLHLSAASAALLASQEASSGMQRFYSDRLMLAAQTARGLGDDLLLPAGVDPRIQRLFESVEVPAAVAVASGGAGGQVFVDGEPVGRSGSRLVPGLRLVQVHGGQGATEVGAASLYPLELPTLLYAGKLHPHQLELDLMAVGQGLPASELVRTLERLLGSRLLVADVSPRGVALRALSGQEVGGSSPSPGTGSLDVASAGQTAADREVLLAWHERLGFGGRGRPLVVGAGVTSGWTVLRDPVAGDLSGLAGGLAVWFRYPTPTWLTLAISTQTLTRREPLPDGYDADWLYRAWVPVRVGVRVDGTFDDLRWELGVDGVASFLGAYDHAQRVVPGAAVAGALARPVIDRRFALRLELHGALGVHFAGAGVIAGLDSTW